MSGSGARFEFGDVVLVPFPFSSDPRESKQRPGVIVSNSTYNIGTTDLILCGITSVLSNTGFSIPIAQSDMEEGMMPAKSLIKYGNIYTLRKTLIIKHIGKINANKRSELVKALASLLNGT
ncbi:MAG: type II toxin-antitoxin system PemK/MazF family toxin [archaeon]|nr:type II toxin-antitoxin system PemK/MazF family toxin [archaeon]